MQEEIIDWQNLASSDYYLLGPIKEGLRGKHNASNEEMKTAAMEWLKKQSTEFYEAGIQAFIKDGTLLLRESETMLRNRDVTHRGPASF